MTGTSKVIEKVVSVILVAAQSILGLITSSVASSGVPLLSTDPGFHPWNEPPVVRTAVSGVFAGTVKLIVTSTFLEANPVLAFPKSK